MQSNNNTEAAIPSPPPTAGSAVPASRGKVAVTFVSKATDAELGAISSGIASGLAGNANFPSPVPSLVTLTAANDAFASAVGGLARGTVPRLVRDQARATLGGILRQLALYVQQASLGDAVKLKGSGFPLHRGHGPKVLEPPSKPVVLKLGRGPASGQVRARCKAVPGALLYQWRLAPSQAPSVWVLTDPSSSSGMLLEDMSRATEYQVQARAFGRRGCSDWSDSVAVVVS